MPRYEVPILVWQWQQLCFVAVALRGYKTLLAARPRRLWAHERGLHRPGFFDQNLLGSFNAREFKGRMRMDVSTFEYLCSTLCAVLAEAGYKHVACSSSLGEGCRFHIQASYR